MKSILNWLAAAASLAGLFFTLQPPSGTLTLWQITFLIAMAVVFGIAAFRDITEERRRAAKTYSSPAAINDYMFAMLRDSGRCEIHKFDTC